MSSAGILQGRRTTGRPLWQSAVVVIGWSATVLSVVGIWALLSWAAPWGDLASLSPVLSGGASVAVLALATFGAVVALRGDAPRYGLIMLLTGATSAIVTVGGLYGLHSLDADVPGAGVAVWIQDLWMVEQMLLVLVLPALLPDGKVAAPAWRRPFRIALTGWVVLIVAFVLADRPASNFLLEVDGPVPSNPTGFLPIPAAAIDVTWMSLGIGSVIVGLGSLLTRWRRAEDEMRQRLKWVLLALGIVVFAVFLRLLEPLIAYGGVEITGAVDFVFILSAVAVAVGTGLAVLRFRLYEVDLVINRTIVYVLLTAALFAAYVGVVFAIGMFLPVEESTLALVATGLIAISFAPLRGIVQRGVNRLMFGQRDDPYALLTEMSQLLASSGTPDETLQKLVDTISLSLKLPAVTIELEENGEWRARASFGDSSESGEKIARIPLLHQGEVVGRLSVAPRSTREPLSSQDMTLLENFAHQAGALARSVRLTVALQHSRERMVLAQEEERRRIRHDLHDELGPSLASQTFQLDAILERLADDPAKARQLLMSLKDQNRRLVADIRRLVYELRPPALDELGIAGAIAAHTSQLERSGDVSIQLDTKPDPLPSLPAAVEVAAYRIAREAIINTVRHSAARTCTTTLEATDAEFVVTVQDDGVGIAAHRTPGVGLTSMRERTEELGGRFQVARAEPSGTFVRATIPLADGAANRGKAVPNG